MLNNQPKIPLKIVRPVGAGHARPAAYRHIPFPHRRPVGAGHARPAAYRNIPFTVQFVGERFIPPGHLSPPQTAAAARGLAALHPHIKPVRRAGCPHPAETYRHIPFPHRRPVGAGHARPAAYRQIPFTINPQGRDSSLPGTLPPPQTAAAARGLAALRPHLKPVRRAGCPHPAETCRPYMHHLYISLNLFIFL